MTGRDGGGGGDDDDNVYDRDSAGPDKTTKGGNGS